MKIVIEIDEGKYNTITSYPKEWDEWALNAIKNGVPLPKGCGRLLVLDEERVNANSMKVGDWSCQKWISEVGISNSVVTIIGSDTESED